MPASVAPMPDPPPNEMVPTPARFSLRATAGTVARRRETTDGRKPPDQDDHPFTRHCVRGARPSPGIEEEPTDDEVKPRQNERDAPEHEEEGRAATDRRRLPEDGEATPEQAEGNPHRVGPTVASPRAVAGDIPEKPLAP